MTELVVRVGTTLRIPQATCPPALREGLIGRFSYPSPDGRTWRSAGASEARWCALTEDEQDLCLPRGLIKGLQKMAGSMKIPLRFVSQVVGDAKAARIEDSGALKLRPYQQEIVEAMDKGVQGYVVLPCGGGKTTAGVAAILRVGQPSLILVGSSDIMDQWVETVKRATGRRLGPRCIGGGKGSELYPLRPGEIVVATVQALHEHPEARKLLQSVAVLLTDEAHHIAATQWRWVVERCPARWRWGLTATPERGDGWGFLLEVLLGPMLYRKTTLDLVQAGFLQLPTIVPVNSSWSPGDGHHEWLVTCPSCSMQKVYLWTDLRGGKVKCKARVVRGKAKVCGHPFPADIEAEQGSLIWSTASTALSLDRTRAQLLGRLAGVAAQQGRRVLVLTARKEALAPIAEAAVQHGARSVDMVASGVDARADRIRGLRTGETDVLVATQLADEALDIPALDCLVMGQAGKDGGRAKQRVGRTTRPAGQPAVVFDVVDAGPVFRRQWRARRHVYEQEYGRGCLFSETPLSVEQALKALEKPALQASAEASTCKPESAGMTGTTSSGSPLTGSSLRSATRT